MDEWRNVNPGLLGRIRDQGSMGDDERVNSLDALVSFPPLLLTTNFYFKYFFLIILDKGCAEAACYISSLCSSNLG